jgi:hypothetical protein
MSAPAGFRALGVDTDRVCTIADLIKGVLATQPMRLSRVHCNDGGIFVQPTVAKDLFYLD